MFRLWDICKDLAPELGIGGYAPDIRSTQVFTLYRSISSWPFINLSASSKSVSPVCLSLRTSTSRSPGGTCLRFGSFTSAMRFRSASSIRIHPRSAYEMLSFQNDR